MNKLTLVFSILLVYSYSFSQFNSAQEYIDKVYEQIEKNEYAGAMLILSFAINEMPDSAQLYNERGVLLETFRNFDKAIEDFSIGIEKSKDSKSKSHFLTNRGGAKSRLRDYQSAYDDFVLALELDSTNLHALNNLAAVCDEVNRPMETLKYLEQIISIDSNYVPAYINIGFKYQNMNNHVKAIEYFDMAIKLSPNEALGYSNRSFSKLKLKDLDGAMSDINLSIKLFSSNSYAYKIRALIYLEKNLIEYACNDLSQAEHLGYKEQFGDEVKNLKEKHCP